MTCLSPVHAWMAPASSMTQLLNTIIQKAQHTWSTCALKSHLAEPKRFDHGTKFYCMSACSVAVSYKPPMLVTRVRLPACALIRYGSFPRLAAHGRHTQRVFSTADTPKHFFPRQRMSRTSSKLTSDGLKSSGSSDMNSLQPRGNQTKRSLGGSNSRP